MIGDIELNLRSYLNKRFHERVSRLVKVDDYQPSEAEFWKLFEETKSRDAGHLDEYERDCGYNIDSNWIDDLALHTQIVIKRSALSYLHGRMLYSTLRKYCEGVKMGTRVNILETGTARGFSSLCMAKALDDSGFSGNIVTCDLLPHNEDMYWNCIDDAQGKKTRRQLLSKWANLVDNYITFVQGDTAEVLQSLGMGRVHFAFLDGAHNYESVRTEIDFLLDKQQKGDVIVFDDYSPDFPGVVRAVKELVSERGYNAREIKGFAQRSYVVTTKIN